MENSGFVVFEKIDKSYDGEVLVVKNLNLNISKGEFVTMLGPSGSGKTTTLMMLAGFETPTNGEIYLDNKPISKIPPYEREIGMVFQNYALFPHMTVQENLAFPLEVRKISKSDVATRVKKALDMVELGEFGNRFPAQLSGGQQQRVALARALIASPRLLLLDEPLSNLDAHLRDEMRDLIVTIQKKLNVTTIFVTHDQEEAVLLADKIALIFDGELQNYTSPKNYYEQPKNIKAAKFFGGVNFIKSKKINNEFISDIGKINYVGENINDLNDEINITIRPENIKLSKTNDFDHNSFKGNIKSIIFSGTHTRYKIIINNLELECSLQSLGIKNINQGDEIFVHLPKDKIWGMND